MSDQQKYSVAEIQNMRESLRWILMPANGSFMPSELDAQIERQLQTHMLNGTDPAELNTAMDQVIRSQQQMALTAQNS